MLKFSFLFWLGKGQKLMQYFKYKVNEFKSIIKNNCWYHGILLVYSPHTWWWLWDFLFPVDMQHVFPTHVVVIIFYRWWKLYLLWYSPHTWWWLFLPSLSSQQLQVFPTHVGVIKKAKIKIYDQLCIPHTRGGDPKRLDLPDVSQTYSPHTWWWSYESNQAAYGFAVFPTHVGVILKFIMYQAKRDGIPHTRGGDPMILNTKRGIEMYSPHTWGWS